MPLIQPLADIPQDLVWRMGVEQYHAMIEAGILTDDDPVELLEGWLIYKMPQKTLHRAATRLVVEVSDTTLRRDRSIKLRAYAKAGPKQGLSCIRL